MFLCPNKIVVIQINTDDGQRNDDFDVFINDQFAGFSFMGEDKEIGTILIGSENASLTLAKENFPYDLVEEYERRRFNELILNSGTNTIRLENVQGNGNGNRIIIRVRLYEIKNGQLVDPLFISDINISGGDGESYERDFELICPLPDGLSTLYQFDPEFIVDTGNLNQIFSGSGTHSRKDVTFFFDVLDQQANVIATNQDFLDNPLIEGAVFDILDTGGNVVFPDYFSGKFARSLTISELDNERIFGEYTKDFGVRIKVPNSFDGSTFTGEFYAYGNVPNIISATPSNYGDTSFYGAPEVTDAIDVRINLQNDLRYVKVQRYDIYAFEEEGVVLPALTFLAPESQEGFLYSQNADNIDSIYNIKINPADLDFNKPYYFTVVPYSELGSGRPISFGPSIFVPETIDQGPAPLDGSELRLFNGNLFSSQSFITGIIADDSYAALDIFSSGDFTTAKYLVEIQDPSGQRISSELKLVTNEAGAFFIEEPINNTGQVSYFIEQAGTNYELYASGISGTGSFKMHKTLI